MRSKVNFVAGMFFDISILELNESSGGGEGRLDFHCGFEQPHTRTDPAIRLCRTEVREQTAR